MLRGAISKKDSASLRAPQKRGVEPLSVPSAISLLAVLCFCLPGCAVKQVPVVQVQTPAVVEPITFTLDASAVAKADNASKVELRGGTRWQRAGKIDQGDIFKSRDQVIALVAFNTHEAWLVINQTRLVGFYLPVERSFVAADPIVLSMTKESSP